MKIIFEEHDEDSDNSTNQNETNQNGTDSNSTDSNNTDSNSTEVESCCDDPTACDTNSINTVCCDG